MDNIVHVDAKISLHGYKEWRRSLVPLPVGTVIEWVEPYTSFTLADNIKAGQLFKLVKVRESFGASRSEDKIDADKVYDMVLVSKTGKEFKKTMAWSIEIIARKIYLGEVKIYEQS